MRNGACDEEGMKAVCVCGGGGREGEGQGYITKAM